MNLSIVADKLPAMSDEAVNAVRALEARMMSMEKVDISTHHQIHGGIYTRTICIQKGVTMIGALVKIPTTLVISGDLTIFTGADEIRVIGYAVLPGSAWRKQAVQANETTWVSMSFPTKSMSIEDVESEFTDEFDKLASRNSTSDQTIITGE